MSISRRLVSPFVALALVASLSGCGTYIVAKSVTGAGSMVVGGAVGAVKVTGKAGAFAASLKRRGASEVRMRLARSR